MEVHRGWFRRTPRSRPIVLKPGELVAKRYHLRHRLGSGGQGEVWLADDTKIGREVALKTLHAHLVDPESRQRFEREGFAQGRVNHPAVVRLYDIEEAGENLLLVMEYVDGVTLQERIEAQPTGLDWSSCATLGAEVADALAVAHAAGVINRDLKPTNILVEHDRGVGLTDFGLALLIGESRLSRTGFAMGSPGYWAPEQVLPMPVTAQTDVYGLCAVLYHAATGTPPYPPVAEVGENRLFDHVMRELRDPRELRPDLPDDAARLLTKGMRKKPEERFESARELASALRATAGLPAVPAPAVRREAPPAPRDADTLQADTIPNARRAPQKHPRAWFTPRLLAGVIPGIVAGALAGAIAGAPTAAGVDGAPVSRGGLSLTLPDGWSETSDTGSGGLGLESPVAVAPRGAADRIRLLVGRMGFPPGRLFPTAFGDRIRPQNQRPTSDDRVAVGDAEGIRYRLALEAGRAATVVVIPTTQRPITAACLAEKGVAERLLTECEAIIATVRTAGSRPMPVGPDDNYAKQVNARLTRIDQAVGHCLAASSDARQVGSRRQAGDRNC